MRLMKGLKITDKEYEDVKAKIAISDASIELKDKAMRDLDARYNEARSVLRARKEFLDSLGDLDDVE
jgi:hypothetical protein